MNLVDAIQITVDLARQNVADHPDHHIEQTEAIATVEDFATNNLGEDDPNIIITRENDDRDFLVSIDPGQAGVWLTVGKHSLYIKRTDEGVIVDGYLSGDECDEASASLQLWDADIEGEAA